MGTIDTSVHGVKSIRISPVETTKSDFGSFGLVKLEVISDEGQRFNLTLFIAEEDLGNVKVEIVDRSAIRGY